MERLLTIEEVAEYLRCPVTTIRWLRQEGRFAPCIKMGRHLMWREKTLLAWMESVEERAS